LRPKTGSTGRVWCCNNSNIVIALCLPFRREKKLSLIGCVLCISERKTSPPRHHRAPHIPRIAALGFGPRSAHRIAVCIAHTRARFEPCFARRIAVLCFSPSSVVSCTPSPRARLRLAHTPRCTQILLQGKREGNQQPATAGTRNFSSKIGKRKRKRLQSKL
jgi:hypothetical protein